MASKTLPASTGYFNKEMIAILEGDKKKKPEKKKTANTTKKGK